MSCLPNDGVSLRKGPWAREEDEKLFAYITRYGYWNWRELPKFAGLSRTGKSCRLRWMNYLRPSIRRENFTREEDELIIRLHETLGNRWSTIATHLPAKSDNEIKNRWHTYLRHRAFPRTQLRGHPTFLFDDYNVISPLQTDVSNSNSVNSTPQLSYSTSSTRISIQSVSTVCSSTNSSEVKPQLQKKWSLFKLDFLVLSMFMAILISFIVFRFSFV